MNSHSEVEVLALWQQQAREEPIVPPDDIRARAERLDAKSRRWRAWTALLVIVLLIKGAVEVWLQEAVLERAGDLLIMAALVYVAYRYRKQRLAAPPVTLGEPTASSSIAPSSCASAICRRTAGGISCRSCRE